MDAFAFLARLDWAERATVRDLLANRSGLPLRASLEFNIDRRQDQDDDGALSRLAADVAAANGPPAGFWSYTNVGWCLLGRVIESVTGVAWEDAMRDHIVHRAGMSGTSFATDPAPPHRASGHEMSPDGPVPVPPLVVRAYGPAGTSVVCTVTDLLRFAAMHLDDPSLATLRTVTADFAIHSFFDSWCLGWGWFDWAGGLPRRCSTSNSKTLPSPERLTAGSDPGHWPARQSTSRSTASARACSTRIPIPRSTTTLCSAGRKPQP